MVALVVVGSHACVGSVELTSAAPSTAIGARPVVFVHGLGSSAADVGAGVQPAFADLLHRIARDYASPGVCDDAFQPARPWDGSPCVFRYVEDISDGGDSQSGVEENAAKLAGDVARVVVRAGGRRTILIGYSMGGAIIRAFLSLHPAEAARHVAAVILVDAVAQGSWGFSLIGEVVRRTQGPVRQRVMELVRSLAANASAVDIDRPAARDLRPRSDVFRRIAAAPPPRTISYYTFWGDVRLTVARRMLVYDLPDFNMPSIGDLGLLPGEPDPSSLPELGGQRFTPAVDAGHESFDIPHSTTIRLDGATIRELIDPCGTSEGSAACRTMLAKRFDVPNTHTAIPFALSRVGVDAFGSRTTLLDAMLAAVARNQGTP